LADPTSSWRIGDCATGDEYERARAAALKAVELDDELAEAHTALAYTTLLYDWDGTVPKRNFRRASHSTQTMPRLITSTAFFSCLQAGKLKPSTNPACPGTRSVVLIVNDVAGWIYYEGRQYDNAIQQYTKTLEMEPDYVPALLDLGTAYMKLGDYRSAIAQFEKARTVDRDSVLVLSDLAQAYALSGDKARQQNSCTSCGRTPYRASFPLGICPSFTLPSATKGGRSRYSRRLLVST